MSRPTLSILLDYYPGCVLGGLPYGEVVRRAETVGRRAQVLRLGPAGRDIMEAVVVSASQLSETMAYRNGLKLQSAHGRF